MSVPQNLLYGKMFVYVDINSSYYFILSTYAATYKVVSWGLLHSGNWAEGKEIDGIYYFGMPHATPDISKYEIKLYTSGVLRFCQMF